MKLSILKKLKITSMVLLLSFTTVLSSACTNQEEKKKAEKMQKKAEELKKKEYDLKKKEYEIAQAKKKEEDKKKEEAKKKKSIFKESDKSSSSIRSKFSDFQQGKISLEKLLEGNINISVDESKEEWKFEYLGEIKERLLLMMDNKDAPETKEIWNDVIENTLNNSKQMAEYNFNPSIIIVNPKDSSKYILKIKGGVVEYDYFKE